MVLSRYTSGHFTAKHNAELSLFNSFINVIVLNHQEDMMQLPKQ